MITFDDFGVLQGKSIIKAVSAVISDYRGSELYRVAVDADLYSAQRNRTIMEFVHMVFSFGGGRNKDFTASNNRICSNFFYRLNVQRNTYSLGNGVTFPEDSTKEKYGPKIDTKLQDAGYYSLIHGVSYMMWLGDRVRVFKATEFAPLWDENTGSLKAGVRFWRIDGDHPLNITLYEEDGYTELSTGAASDSAVHIVQDKTPYVVTTLTTEADGVVGVTGSNYPALPIIPIWGSKLKQSTLVGMRSSIDSFDLIRSGFANDLTDCAQIYWIIENAGGMDDQDLAMFRDRLKLSHIASVDTDSGGGVKPYVQEIPSQARQLFLDGMRSGIYEDFGALDVHNISAAAKTATEIEAAYQPLDENADDFEYQIIDSVQRLGSLIGIPEEESVPIFKRNRIYNQKEQVEVITLEAPYLDERTILEKLPNISVDEVDTILKRRTGEEILDMGV